MEKQRPALITYGRENLLFYGHQVTVKFASMISALLTVIKETRSLSVSGNVADLNTHNPLQDAQQNNVVNFSVIAVCINTTKGSLSPKTPIFTVPAFLMSSRVLNSLSRYQHPALSSIGILFLKLPKSCSSALQIPARREREAEVFSVSSFSKS